MQLMTKQNKALGRPSKKVDKALVRELRNEKGLSQLELAKLVYKAAEDRKASTETMKTTAYRWEKLGTVQLHLEEHLATALGVPLAVLRGERTAHAPSRVEYLAEQIRRNAEQGEHPELKATLEEYERYGEDDPIKALADDLNRELEWAQVTQDVEEHRRIERMTGLTKADISNPTSHHGTWLLITSAPSAPQRCEILQGIREVLHQVHAELKRFREDHNESDAEVVFRKTNHWFTVTCIHPTLRPLASSIRFARFQAMEKGLIWTKAAKEDEEEFSRLSQSAYSLFNFVRYMDEPVRPVDVKRLRLLIKEIDRSPAKGLSGTIESKQIKPFAGTLTKLRQQTLDNFRAHGMAHSIAIDRLKENLWSYVQQQLSRWPLECWSLRCAEGRIDILLDKIPLQLLQGNGPLPNLGWRFTLSLVELEKNGSHRAAPWADDSVKVVFKTLLAALAEAKQQPEAPPRP